MEKVEAISRSLIDSAFSYSQYRAHLDTLMAQNKTTGENQEDWLINYAKLNIARMARLDKTFVPKQETQTQLMGIETPLIFLTITEGWCGDAAQILPIIEKLRQLIPDSIHKLILRDEHPAIMDAFLTNGKSRSIPITVILNASNLEVLGKWGPRPKQAQQLMDALAAQQADFDIIKNELHSWYAQDKGESIADEFMDALMHALERLSK